MGLVLFIAVGLTVFLLVALLLAPVLLRPSRAARRMLEKAQSNRPDIRSVGFKEQLQGQIITLAENLQARLGMAEGDEVRQKLVSAGMRSEQAGKMYAASRYLVPAIGVACGCLIRSNRAFWALSTAGVGYLLPDFWLRMKIRARQERIRTSLPDALDLMVICVEAGLGLDQAMLRVGQEMIISHPDIHQEFLQVNLEQLAGKPRLDAWRSAADRIQIAEFGLFVNMLTQADRFGTPIVRALSRFGEEIRQKRRQRAEEAAAKTKIKILFPLVLFIFPCIFVVLLAPAILNIAKNMQAFR
jgi:tight adherence protein C